MASDPRPTRKDGLRKELRLLDIYALATGATLSAGLFLLPGLAAEQAGPAIVLAYVLAALPLLPAMLCAVELATAMPRAGGAYYFLDRSLGPMAGTVGGLGTWLALTLKTSFALIGIGAYLSLFLPDAPGWLVKGLAAAFAILFGVLNCIGAKSTGSFQISLVVGLLAILFLFLVRGSVDVELARFEGFFAAGTDSILSTAGLVYISYVGITKVASVSEEVQRPDRDLPRAVFLSLATALVIYVGCTVVMVGVLPMEELVGSQTPMAGAAERMLGRPGVVLISVAALLAFSSVANAGILSASRYPWAMARDQLLPARFQTLSSRGTPVVSVLTTVGAILFFLLALDPLKIAKLASAFQLMMFALLCLGVIVMREARIPSYDPAYRTPWYPWTPIAGIVTPFLLVAEMGWLPIVFSLALVGAGVAWFRTYARHRVERFGAIYHVFERLGRRRFDALDTELRTILKEKGLREQDPFEEVIARAVVLDVDEGLDFEELVHEVVAPLAPRLGVEREVLWRGFLEGTRTGATPVAGGAALPHLRLGDLDRPHLALVRCRTALSIPTGDVFGTERPSEAIHAIFFLISPEDDSGQHLRMLARLASRIDEEDFVELWLAARDEEELRALFLPGERLLQLAVREGGPGAAFQGRSLREVRLPEGSLVVAVQRAGATLVPRADTRIELGDRLTIIGEAQAIATLRTKGIQT